MALISNNDLVLGSTTMVHNGVEAGSPKERLNSADVFFQRSSQSSTAKFICAVVVTLLIFLTMVFAIATFCKVSDAEDMHKEMQTMMRENKKHLKRLHQENVDKTIVMRPITLCTSKDDADCTTKELDSTKLTALPRNFSVRCIKLFKDDSNPQHKDAHQKCHDKGAFLAEITDSATLEFVKDQYHQVHGSYWMGGKKESGKSSTWMWPKSGHMFSVLDWAKGEPDGGFSCMGFANNHWHDTGCHNEWHGYICQQNVRRKEDCPW